MTIFAQAWRIWPQLVFLGMSLLTVCSDISTLAACLLWIFIMYKGGFFVPLGVSP